MDFIYQLDFQVLDVVRAAEMLTLNSTDSNSIKPKSPGGPKSGDIQKTTTIVMSKHTLAPQADQVSVQKITYKKYI